MKKLLIIISLFLSPFLIGQKHHLCLGLNGNGICLGDSVRVNGLRLNLWDQRVVFVNGINISGYSDCKVSNGISIGIISNVDSISNGLKIGGLLTFAERHNGIAISGLLLGGNKFNGFGFSGFFLIADTLNGFFIGLNGVLSWHNGDSINIINGLVISVVKVESSKTNGCAIGGLFVSASEINGMAISLIKNSFKKQNGVSISIFNKAEELHGFQFGILNYAGNNRKIFRWIPFVNFHLKKTPNNNL